MKNLEKTFSHDIKFDIERGVEECCKQFIKNLEKDYKKFKKNLKIEESKFNELENINKGKHKIKISFCPENISSQSPVTIINAPWGAGKTYFIEEICKYIIKDEIKPEIIKNIIVVDAWKFSASDGIPDELMSELFFTIVKEKNDKIQRKIYSALRFFYNVCAQPWTNKFLGIELEKINPKKYKPNDYIEKINEIVNEPTLVILDNIERIGSNSWEIIKAIQKLTVLKNFIFILPMNKEKLNDSYKTNSGEWSIEKYINIPFYEFKQNFCGFLHNIGFIDEYANLINEILNSQKNIKITLRELKNIIVKIDLLNEFNINKYSGLRKMKAFCEVDIINEFVQYDIGTLENIVEELNNEYEIMTNIIFKKEWQSLKSFFIKWYDQVIFKDKINIDNFIDNFEKDNFLEMKTPFFNDGSNNYLNKKPKRFINKFHYDWEKKWNYLKKNLKQFEKYILDLLDDSNKMEAINQNILEDFNDSIKAIINEKNIVKLTEYIDENIEKFTSIKKNFLEDINNQILWDAGAHTLIELIELRNQEYFNISENPFKNKNFVETLIKKIV